MSPAARTAMKDTETKPEEQVVIKKYANRRLYNMETSSYVTLDDLYQMVREGTDFVVYDAKNGEDLTRQVLTQIIFEQESKGSNLLPISFLRSLISFYDNNIKDFVPHYLDSSMQALIKNQEAMQQFVTGAISGSMNNMGGFSPMAQFEELSKQNMEWFGKAMEMFSAPYYRNQQSQPAKKPGSADTGSKK